MSRARETYAQLAARHSREDCAVMAELVGKVDDEGFVALGRKRVQLSRVLFELGQEQRHAEELAAGMEDPAFARDAFVQAMFDNEFDDSFQAHETVLSAFCVCGFDAGSCATVADLVRTALGGDARLIEAYLAARQDFLSACASLSA